MGLDSIISGVSSRAKTGAKNVWEKSTNPPGGSGLDKALKVPGATLGAIGVESLRFGTGIAADVTKWTIGKLVGIGLGTAKLGLQSLTLIPLPMPWGSRSIAEVRGDVMRLSDAYKIKLSGSPDSFSDIMKSVRDNAQRQAIGTEPPALSA